MTPTERNEDKLLFTPGPLTTSSTVKAAMLHDLGSRDYTYIEVVRRIRQRLLALAGQGDDSHYVAIPVQGSGTSGIEAVVSSTLGPDDKLLVIVNGAYGTRIARIATIHHIPVATLVYPENALPRLDDLETTLRDDPAISMVAVVHCETTTGLLNQVEPIGAIAHRYHCQLFVDAMSSFGAIPLDFAAAHITYLVSSANKCVEGVPGFSFVLAERAALLATEGYARTLTLDLLAQWRGLEKNGQFSYTPPIQVMLAFDQALTELEQEGGVIARGARYQANHRTLIAAMREMGFREYVDPAHQSPIITTFLYPQHPAFDFETFYRALNEQGLVIYPGKLTHADCFRIASIGRLYPEDMQRLVAAIRQTCQAMGIPLPLSQD